MVTKRKKSRTIVPDVYDHIGNVLRKMHRTMGSGSEFVGVDYVPQHDAMYPNDRVIYLSKGKQTFEHHIDGMLWEYMRRAREDSSYGPSITQLGIVHYRFD